MEEKTPILILQMGTDFYKPPKKIQIEIIMKFNVPKTVCFPLQSIESETPIEIVSRNQTTQTNPPTRRPIFNMSSSYRCTIKMQPK